jgi:hypothetical protein
MTDAEIEKLVERLIERMRGGGRPRRQVPPLDLEQRVALLPMSAKNWLRMHPEFMDDTAMNRKIQAEHTRLVETDGIQAFSPAYFDALDQRFGFS